MACMVASLRVRFTPRRRGRPRAWTRPRISASLPDSTWSTASGGAAPPSARPPASSHAASSAPRSRGASFTFVGEHDHAREVGKAQQCHQFETCARALLCVFAQVEQYRAGALDQCQHRSLPGGVGAEQFGDAEPPVGIGCAVERGGALGHAGGVGDEAVTEPPFERGEELVGLHECAGEVWPRDHPHGRGEPPAGDIAVHEFLRPARTLEDAQQQQRLQLRATGAHEKADDSAQEPAPEQPNSEREQQHQHDRCICGAIDEPPRAPARACTS